MPNKEGCLCELETPACAFERMCYSDLQPKDALLLQWGPGTSYAVLLHWAQEYAHSLCNRYGVTSATNTALHLKDTGLTCKGMILGKLLKPSGAFVNLPLLDALQPGSPLVHRNCT